eukprot:gene16422-biopygen11868
MFNTWQWCRHRALDSGDSTTIQTRHPDMISSLRNRNGPLPQMLGHATESDTDSTAATKHIPRSNRVLTNGLDSRLDKGPDSRLDKGLDSRPCPGYSFCAGRSWMPTAGGSTPRQQRAGWGPRQLLPSRQHRRQ